MNFHDKTLKLIPKAAEETNIRTTHKGTSCANIYPNYWTDLAYINILFDRESFIIIICVQQAVLYNGKQIGIYYIIQLTVLQVVRCVEFKSMKNKCR